MFRKRVRDSVKSRSERAKEWNERDLNPLLQTEWSPASVIENRIELERRSGGKFAGKNVTDKREFSLVILSNLFDDSLLISYTRHWRDNPLVVLYPNQLLKSMN